MAINITYKIIWKALLMEFKIAGKSYQQIRNHKSVIKQWMRFFAQSWESQISEFENFEKNLNSFLEGMKYANNSKPSRKYWLNKFYKIYLKLTTNNDLPGTFPERLKFLMKKSNISRKQVADIFGVCLRSVSGWYSGETNPSRKYFHNFSKLEQLLDVTEGALSDLIKYWVSDSKNKRNLMAKTQYSKLQQIRTKDSYKLHFDKWPEKTKEQWLLLKEYHTTQMAPVLPRNPRAVWDRDSTVQSRRKLFEYFFGYITLPVTKGGLGLEISICDLRIIYETTTHGNLKYFEPYMDFLKSRTVCHNFPNGVYTNTLKGNLNIIAVFINSKTGFMRNAPQFSDYVSSIGLTWKEVCDKAMDRIKSISKGTKFQQVRYPEEPIDFILKDQHPLKYLISLIHNLKLDIPLSIERKWARRLLNMYFVCAFLTAIPLRASMLCKMRLDKNIYKDQRGGWHVRFDITDFKNHKGAARDTNYDIACPNWLCPIIDLYLLNRPFFPGGKISNGEYECDIFIRPSSNNGVYKENIKPINIHSIYVWCRTATSNYIPDCLGFGPHAWRHIVATDWIKNNPNGVQIAAKVLNDRFDTVMSNYQHLLTSDWLIHYNIYSDSHFLIDKKCTELKFHSSQETSSITNEDGYVKMLKLEEAKITKLEVIVTNQANEIRKLTKKITALIGESQGSDNPECQTPNR